MTFFFFFFFALICNHSSKHLGKNTMVKMKLKIGLGYTNLDTKQIQSSLGSRVYFLTPTNANMAGCPTQHYEITSLFLKFKMTHHKFSFIYCKAQSHEYESVKIMYLDAMESFICSKDVNDHSDLSRKYG